MQKSKRRENMNVIMPKEYKVSKRDIIIYTGCIVVCVVALTVIMTIQIVGRRDLEYR